MKRYRLFMVILSLILIFGLTQGCDKDNGEETTTPTTPTEPTPEPSPTPTAAPTCSLSPDPQIVRYGETSKLNITITGGPASGSFSPSSGGCGSFADSSGGSCTTASLTTPGENTFTLTVSNAGGTSTCSGKVYVGCENYRVWNDTGVISAFRIERISFADYCQINVANGSEITESVNERRLHKGKFIRRSQLASSCIGQIGTLSYDEAMNSDSKATGGDGDCRVNFTGSDR